MKVFRSLGGQLAAGILLAGVLTVFSGCERKEETLDVETPSGELEVEEDPQTGDTDVEVNEN